MSNATECPKHPRATYRLDPAGLFVSRRRKIHKTKALEFMNARADESIKV
jgi:hypothetical protein